MFINSKKLYKNIEFEYIDQQLPVGVFKNEVKKNTAFFTAGKSAIDLWAIKGDEFWIFELKFNNKQVGIITELLFYMWLSQDMFEHKLNYIITDRPSAIRSFDKLYQFRENGKTKNFVGVMLYDKIHPLIDTDVIDYINIQFKNKPLQIKTQEYSIKQELI